MATEPTNLTLEQLGRLEEADAATALPIVEAEKEKKFFGGDAKRKEEAKQVIHNIFIWFVRIAGVVFLTLFIIRMLHFMLPTKCCWLDETRLQAIDKFLFSGALGGAKQLFFCKLIFHRDWLAG